MEHNDLIPIHVILWSLVVQELVLPIGNATGDCAIELIHFLFFHQQQMVEI